jgi:hypothetical protein
MTTVTIEVNADELHDLTHALLISGTDALLEADSNAKYRDAKMARHDRYAALYERLNTQLTTIV